MSEKCEKCKGTGFLTVTVEKCPQCGGSKGKGSGKVSVDLMALSEQNLSSILSGECPKCGGTGEIEHKIKCDVCRGSGEIYHCRKCGKQIPYLNENNEEICNMCRASSTVYRLDASCDYDDLGIGKYYVGVVDGIVENLGAFVRLNDNVKGLMHEKNITKMPEKGEEQIVYLKDMRKQGRDVKLDLVQKNPKEYEISVVEKNVPGTHIGDITPAMNGKLVRIRGEVIQVKQTGGPTIFTISDETGTAPCAGFSTAGQRSYAHIDAGMIVSAVGTVNLRDGAVQIELAGMKELPEEEKIRLLEIIEKAIDEKATPHDIPFLAESEILEKLRPAMLQAAKEIRRAIFRSRPIILRHHSDADGITSGMAIEKAILPLIEEVNNGDVTHFYKRAPSKAPFYELADVVKDVSYSVEDNLRYGEPFPLIIMVDNGSTEEDMPAYLHTQVYGMDVVVIDHHHPDEAVDQFLIAHVNPYHVGGDFGLTAGMLCTETARLINPDVTDQIIHLPAVAGVGDRAVSPEFDQYLELVKDRYTTDNLKEMALALDYEQYWLKFSAGVGVIDDILDFRDHDIHSRLVKMLCAQADSMIREQIDVCLPNVEMTKLKSGAVLNIIDVEKYAHKFTFPAPGKTSGEIHDIMCRDRYPGQPVITLGLGPDFAVIRSKNVLMNIPQIVRELREELVGAGVNGGGHLIVGSIKFVEGAKETVVKRLIEKLAEADVEKSE